MCRKGYDIIMGCPTVHDFIAQFKNEQEAFDFIVKHIYPDGKIVCPHCGCTEYIYSSKQYVTEYNCGHCKKSVIPTRGTMFEFTLLPFKFWLYVMYSMFVSRKSISNYQLMRETHKCNQSVSRTRRKIQAAMANCDFEGFSGIVQIDEAFLGGSNHGRYTRENESYAEKKYPVFGIFEEGTNRVYSVAAIPDEKGKCLTKERCKYFIETTCKPGTTIVTDEWRSYKFLEKPDSGYKHESVDHSVGQRTNEDGYTTNGIEGYWSLVKRMYYSTHSNLPKEYIDLYLTECDFRFNHRNWREAIDDILVQGVFFPQVIDIRRMGKFGNKTYDLKKYRMILPKCFDEINIEDITVEDILCCEEPVYGILRKPYKSRKQQGHTQIDLPSEWKKLGLVKGGIGYRNYRDKITNTIKDVENMIKDATKYKEVNDFVVTTGTTYKPKYRPYHRKRKLRKKYEELPPMLQTQIKQEYPYMMKVSSAEKTIEIRKRMTELRRWYEKNKEIIEGVNY